MCKGRGKFDPYAATYNVVSLHTVILIPPACKAVPYLLHLLQSLRASLGIRREPSKLLQVQAILLQMAGNILSRHAIHIHQLQDCLRNSILDTLHQLLSSACHSLCKSHVSAVVNIIEACLLLFIQFFPCLIPTLVPSRWHVLTAWWSHQVVDSIHEASVQLRGPHQARLLGSSALTNFA